jgi:hypothetical protein
MPSRLERRPAPDRGRRRELTRTDHDAASAFTLDALGEFVSSAPAAPSGGHVVPTAYLYDPAGHLASIDDGTAADLVTYSLDALGRHATQQIGSGPTTSYEYLGTSASVSSLTAGTAVTYSAIDAIGDRIGIDDGASSAYLVADLHGNVALRHHRGSPEKHWGGHATMQELRKVGSPREVTYGPSEIDALLRRNGWSQQRSIDISRDLAALQRHGIATWLGLEAFLRQFSDIRLRYMLEGRRDEVWFSAERAAGTDENWGLEYARRVGSRMAPIGRHGHATIYLSEDGRFFGGFDAAFALYGTTALEAISNIVNNHWYVLE